MKMAANAGEDGIALDERICYGFRVRLRKISALTN
jgi:hypothetical protein